METWCTHPHTCTHTHMHMSMRAHTHTHQNIIWPYKRRGFCVR